MKTKKAPYLFTKSILAGLAALVAVGISHAAFPERPIKLVVPYTPGGAADQLSRALGDGLSKELGQPVVIENKPGGNTMVAATSVARSDPDGYTIFLASNASMVLNPMLYSKLGYSAETDFRVISIVAELPLVVVANNTVPATTLEEFTTFSKANPGKLNYASVGLGNPLQLATELLKSKSGLDALHVPFNGSAPALTSLIANDTQMMVDVIITSLPLIKDKRIKALAVMSDKRLAVLPEVPTVAESGVPGFQAATWFGIAAPQAVPPDVVASLHTALNKVVSQPDFKSRFEMQGMVIQQARTASETQDYVAADRSKWRTVIEANAIKLD